MTKRVYTHDSICICANCSAERRERWRNGEPEIDLTKQEKAAVVIFLTLAISAVFLVIAVLSGCGTVRQPSCGEYHAREADGAACRECNDPHGNYAECHTVFPVLP